MVIDALLANLLVKRAPYPSRRGLREYPKLFTNISPILVDLSKIYWGCGTRARNIKLPLEREKEIVPIEAVLNPCLKDCSLIRSFKTSAFNFKPNDRNPLLLKLRSLNYSNQS